MINEGGRIKEFRHVPLSLGANRLADFEPLFEPLPLVFAVGSNFAAAEVELCHEFLSVTVVQGRNRLDPFGCHIQLEVANKGLLAREAVRPVGTYTTSSFNSMLENLGVLVEAHGACLPASERGQTVDASLVVRVVRWRSQTKGASEHAE